MFLDIMKTFLGREDLNVYPHAAKKGMKIYSNSEINRSSGYERLYKIFWNKKLEEVCSDRVLVKWTKTAIEGIVATEWTLKKTPLMNNHAMQLLSQEYPEHIKIRQKQKTMEKNLAEMLYVHKRLLYLDDKLRHLRKPSNTKKNKKGKIAELEVELKAKLAELKKAQECLRKSFENMAREKNVRNTEISTNMEVNTDKLNREEIELLLAHMEKENVKTFEVDSSDSDESLPVSYNSPSGTIADSLPSTSQNYQQSLLKRNLACSEDTPDHGQESPFSVGDGSFNTITNSQNLDSDDLLQEILGEIAQGTPLHKSKKRKINP
jgi:hypothetical protein